MTTCTSCHTKPVAPPRAQMQQREAQRSGQPFRPTCLACGEAAALRARTSWTVLTPHKQGAMLFTAEFAREAARGINNKGGLVK
jgi:hypothetical protein